MVTVFANKSDRRRTAGMLMMDFIIALGIFATAMIPMGYSYVRHREFVLDCYRRAVVLQILDGEMEVLHAGGWRAFSKGVHEYPVRVRSAANLPPGVFRLELSDKTIQLHWLPQNPAKGRAMKREVAIE